MSPSTPDRTANLLGALALATADRLHQVTEEVAGHRAAAPAALVALHEFLDGGTVGELRSVVGLTPSGAVRLADRLEADGYVRRRRGEDGRSVQLHLTPRGRRLARRVIEARTRALLGLVDDLDDGDRQHLTKLLERLLERTTVSRLAERSAGDEPSGGWLCRLCDLSACGRDTGDCPTANAAQQALATDRHHAQGHGDG